MYSQSPLTPSGFPSPAEGFGEPCIDLNRELIRHPQATFLMRIRTAPTEGAGFAPGDVVLIDRATVAASGHLVVAVIDDEFVIRQLVRQNDRWMLQIPGNPMRGTARCADEPVIEIWGVVTHLIRPCTR